MTVKRALVTGAAGGIGSAIARRLSQDGYWLALLDIEDPPELPSATPGGRHFVCDVSDPVQVEQVFAEIEQTYEVIHAIVNVAGINHQSSVADMAVEAWNRLFDINVGGMFLVSKYGLPLMPKDGTAALVNMASISGYVATRDYPAYVTSKAAVEGFTEALARDVGAEGIRINAVAPGWVNAGFTDKAMATVDDPNEILNSARKAHLLERMAEPEEIAAAVNWLCSANASLSSGSTLFVDGGLMRVH